MEDYNKIIDSITVKFIKCKCLDIISPVRVKNFYDVDNTIIFLKKGQIAFGPNKEILGAGGILFIPAGRATSISYGHNADSNEVNNEEYMGRKEDFFKIRKTEEEDEDPLENFIYVTFSAKVFDTVNFFNSLDIPSFMIPQSDGISSMMRSVFEESLKEEPGKEKVLKIFTEYLVVETIRFIVSKQLFVEQLATNATYFKDPRLVDIFAFIKDNLAKDLSNKVLSTVANVSEDYVGQYFKMLTGINPQDYIEYQRMERAVELLRTSKKSIRTIGIEVGYKDTAYFCRRFKMMFGIPAGKMRKRENIASL